MPRYTRVAFGFFDKGKCVNDEWSVEFFDEYSNATNLGNMLASFKGKCEFVTYVRIASDLALEQRDSLIDKMKAFVKLEYGVEPTFSSK